MGVRIRSGVSEAERRFLTGAARRAAGRPILHVPARAAYDAAQIEAEVGRALGG